MQKHTNTYKSKNKLNASQLDFLEHVILVGSRRRKNETTHS